MKKLVVFACVLCMLSCEEKDISLYPTFEQSAIFQIETGSFIEQALITESEISGSVDDATDGEAAVDRVVIEGLWIEITPNAKNTAQEVTLDWTIQGAGGSEKLPILKDYTFEVKKSRLVFLGELQKEGVSELKAQLNAIAKGTPSGDVRLTLQGVTSPSGSVADITVEVFVRATVVYTTSIGS